MINRSKSDNDAAVSQGAEAVHASEPFKILPSWRMYPEFPWQVWATGWLAIFKAFIWLATDPTIASPLAERLAAKFLITMIPFLVLGLGVWNLKRWAVWGLVGLCALDLLFFIVFPNATRAVMGSGFWGISIVLLLFNGPPGDILILISTPVLVKSLARKNQIINNVRRSP